MQAEKADLPERDRHEIVVQLVRGLRPAQQEIAVGLENASGPALKQGLQSKHPLVRFCSAEALAYLGSPACADELARAVKQQPYLRAYALTAKYNPGAGGIRTEEERKILFGQTAAVVR